MSEPWCRKSFTAHRSCAYTPSTFIPCLHKIPMPPSHPATKRISSTNTKLKRSPTKAVVGLPAGLPAPGPLTHFNNAGQAHMVDVAAKASTTRVAVASGCIVMKAETLQTVRAGGAGKGDVLGVARIAAIMAAKRTSELIPLCHPVALSHVSVEFECLDSPASVRCVARAECVGQTGVEMEALTAVQIGLLTIYDMCKAIDRGMEITAVRLEEKRGGKSGTWRALPRA